MSLIPGIGVFTREIEGRDLRYGCALQGLRLTRSGLKTGDEILTVDGAPFPTSVQSFQDKVGSAVTLSVRRERDGAVSIIELRPERIELGKALRLANARESARIIENEREAHWIHSCLVLCGEGLSRHPGGAEFRVSSRMRMRFIWDLRDGWGGASPDYLDLFNARAPDMTFTQRFLGRGGFCELQMAQAGCGSGQRWNA